ncbi:MAG TPA: PAS domain S-box protein, partial [Methanoregula sp.]|nr:PAS domain S-box protein [Methanoregula sp.]
TEKTGTIDFDVTIVPLHGTSGGQITGYLVQLQDITEWKKADTALRESEEKYRALIESTSDFIWETDPAFRYTYCSPQMDNLWGIKPETMNGKTPFDVMPPEELKKVTPFIQELVASPHAFSGFVSSAIVSGRLIHVETSGVPFFDADGALLGYRGISRDITDRMQADEMIRARENELRTVTNVVPALISYVGADHRYRWVNKGYEDWFGMSSGQVEGRHVRDVLGESTYEKIRDRLDRALGGETVTIEEQVPGKTGEPRWVSATLVPARDAAGTVAGVIAHVVDITERRQSEANIRESEERLRLAQSGANIGIWDRDLVTGVLTWTPEMAQLYGYEPDMFEKTYEAFRSRVHPDDLERIERIRDEAIAAHRPFEYDFRIVLAHGEIRWISCKGSAQYGSDGRPQRIFGVNTDITERVWTGEALRESEERFRRITESSQVQIAVTSLEDGEVFFTNASFDNAFGYAAGELIGKKSAIFYSNEQDREILVRELKKNNFLNDYEVNVRKKDGTPFWTMVSIRIIDYGGKKAILNTGVDITERKRAEMALRDALAEREVLLSEIHHRVKNNLSAFISLISLEGSYDNTPTGIAMRNDLQNRARSMALIHETLYKTQNFSSVDMQIYLNTLVEQIAGTYKMEHPVEITVNATGVTLDIGRATPVGLIVNELVTNAIKYAFPSDKHGAGIPGTVAITMIRTDGRYCLKVKDNGIGLPPGFDVQSTRTLGLKLVNFLARYQMRSTVTINSSEGTEFVFEFGDDNNV